MRPLLIFLLAPIAAAVAAIVSADPASHRPKLQIINATTQPVDVFWLSPKDGLVPAASLKASETKEITTTLGQRYRLVGHKDQAQATVTALVPKQAFRFQEEPALAADDLPDGRVGVPPPGLGIPSYYTKFIRTNGYPMVASERVSDYALREAAYLVDQMLAERPKLRAALAQSGARMCIIGWNELTTQLPEYTALTPKDFWDVRARGLGGNEDDPCCSCAEENLLGYRGDPDAGVCILIHEFAHNVQHWGMPNVDPTFDHRLQEAYDHAMRQGFWKDAYAATNAAEYFAVGVQAWFDNARDHNVKTRTDLQEYDPDLAALCREVFGDTAWRYTSPATRLTGHLAGYDPARAPSFAWPERLRETVARMSPPPGRRPRAWEPVAPRGAY